MLKVLDAKVVNVKYRMRRRGSALLLVVVLVLMLAMMGTAFIMTVRISRDQITGTGSSIVILPDADYWPQVPNVDARLSEGAEEIKNAVRTDLERAVRMAGQYRQPGSAFEEPYVAPVISKYLAARYPSLPDQDEVSQVRWQSVSILDSRNFASPLSTSPALGTTYTNLFPLARRIQYPAPFDPIPTLAGRTRYFPALSTNPTDDETTAPLAADADGDGIADSGLFPLTTVPSETVTLKDGDHTATFWGAVRIIDNSGAVNVNTAWRSTADRDASGTDIDPADPLYAYLGTFRPNVGLYELLRGVDTNVSRVAQDAEVNADFTSPTGLEYTRNGGVQHASMRVVADPGIDPASVRTDAEFLTQGDALHHQLARRLAVPGYNHDGSAAVQYSALPGNLTEDLAYHFCLMNPNFTATQFRSILDRSLVRHSPNFSWDLRKRAGFRFFGATHYDFWYHTIFNTDATTGGTPVNPYVGTRDYFFTNAPRPANPFPIDHKNIRKSVRHNLVESNPLSMATPDPRIEFTGLPASVKDTSQTNENLMPVYTHTAPKANVNVDGFGKLWRAYWSVFAAGGWTSPQPMRRSAAWGGTFGQWQAEHWRVLRGALAAVNTLTARNPESTYYDSSGTAVFTPPADQARAESRTFSYGPFDITVYGVRRQAFITEVLIERDETGVQYLAVELYNPYNQPLTIAGYCFAVLNGNTLSNPVTIPTLTIPARGYLTIEDGARPIAPNPVNVVGSSQVVAGLRAMIGTDNEIVLLRTRRDDGVATSNSAANNTYNEANVYDLIPIDQFSANIAPNSSAGVVDRFHYVRANVASGGNVQPFRAVWAGDLELEPDTPGSLQDGTLGGDNTNTQTGGMRTDLSIPLAVGRNSIYLNPLLTGGLGSPNRFPFGAFARDGDITSVPYIGHYRISASGNPSVIYELNSVSVDATLAEDGDTANDADEPVGRFIPLSAMRPGTADGRYEFAHRLFEYVTAIDVTNDEFAPEEVTTPQVERNRWTAAGNGTAPAEVEANAGGALGAGVQGRININTASWQVLAALPIVPGNPQATEAIAKAIVLDRETVGPFRSIFDLNRVNYGGNLVFMSALGDPASVDFGLAHGDLSPNDGLVDDYEQRTLMITRLSNLLTTRSDSFTAYVLVQAWLDANTATPVLAAEKRFVFTIDRSKLTSDPGTTIDIQEIMSQNP